MTDIANLLRYLADVIGHKDTLSEFLDLLPVEIQDATLTLGQWLVQWIW
jgi:hypothetical protein